jgi:hypothetical protein
MATKQQTINELIERWFKNRQALSKEDFEMIKEMYWVVKK